MDSKQEAHLQEDVFSCFCICYAKYPCNIIWLEFIFIIVWVNQVTLVRGDYCALQAVKKLIKFNIKTNQKKPDKQALQKLTKLT